MTLPPLTLGIREGPADSPGTIRKAAQEFESMLIEQMLKAARTESESGSLGPGEKDEAGQTMLDLADQQLARVMAANGGLGLARMLEQDLARPKTAAARSPGGLARPDAAPDPGAPPR